MFYKFASSSQTKDTDAMRAALGGSLNRPGLDANATLAESTTKRIPDGGFSQLHPSYTRGVSPYQFHVPEIEDKKSHAFERGTPSRFGFETIDTHRRLHALGCSTSFSRDDSKKTVKVNAQELDQIQTTTSSKSELVALSDLATRIPHLLDEVAQKHDCIENLELRLAAKNEENAKLSRDLSRMETAYKQEMSRYREALGRMAKNNSALKSELDDLKTSSQSLSLIVSEAKATMDSFAALRDSIQIRLREIEAMTDDDGQFLLTAETRETVNELRSELSKTQQVADLLREELHTMGTELAEARARVLELEESATADRNRSELTALNIRQSADRMTEVVRLLQEQKQESIQATMKMYEMEQQFAHAQSRFQEAQSTITSMREEMTMREELLQEQGAKLLTLRNTVDFQEGNVKAIEARVRKAEEELVQALNYNHKLQGRLDAATSLEKTLTQQASQLLSERDELKEKLHSIERQLAESRSREASLSTDMAKTLIERNVLVEKLDVFDDLKREANVYREKHAVCQVSLKVLQERFDDQCVTLAAAKESIGDLQERLHATGREAMETSVKQKQELIHLQDQNAALKAETEDKFASLRALQNELSRKEGTFEALLETERLGKKGALDQMEAARAKVESLQAELAEQDYRMLEMAKRLAAAEAPSTEREREVEALKVRIDELEAIKKQLVDRAATISRRYENNDLNDDEKALVALLVRKARAIHDREMVEKNNEIKRRDSIIREDKARITHLESVLACWAEERALGKKADEQGNSTAVDATKPQESSPDHQPDIRGVGSEVISTTVIRGTTDEASVDLSIPGPSSRSTNYSTFAKLCREDTDDIADFDDEHPPAATGKRVTFSEVEDERPARRLKQGKVEKAGADQPVAPTSGTGSGNKKRAAPRRR